MLTGNKHCRIWLVLPCLACLFFRLTLCLAIPGSASTRLLSEQDTEGLESGLLHGNETQAEIGHDGNIIGSEHGEGSHDDEEEHSEKVTAVLFPAFALTLGVVVFFLLTRYMRALPFTAVMFLIGTLMGIGVELLNYADDHLAETTRMWANIDSHVLLLVFLPGLIFKDSFGLNVHLFRVAAWQCLIFAFPMVLAGTLLTAMVAQHVFPYGWNFNLAMTFGSILSATDPVAVAALLEEVGAPPRLKVHIAGEALLNDGAAIVFFSIFVERFLHDLGEVGVGEDVGWALGFEKFFQMSLGGAAIGIAFGIGLLGILYLLDRRFSREENVVEVTATVGVAYLNYYVAELVCHTSGVIATLACGITLKFVGRAMINDAKLLDDFWVLVEHLLNTILFLLGGVVWGSVIASSESDGIWQAREWGYLFVLYFLLTAIRFVLFAAAYPLTVRIGLKTNWKETVFQVYGGLRGAVGIALAIALEHDVTDTVGEDSMYYVQTRRAFGMVGGIAFLTLVINGSTSGPLLKKFGLADSSESREKIVECFQARFKRSLQLEFVSLLTQRRFRQINFGLVKVHVPYLADMTKTQLAEAIQRHEDITATEDYHPPYLEGVLPYLTEDPPEAAAFGGNEMTRSIPQSKSMNDLLAALNPVKYDRKKEHEKRAQNRNRRRRRKSTMRYMMSGEPLSAQEMRALFISILKANYERQIERGELVDQEFLAIALEQSLEFAADGVSNGQPLKDWEYVHIFDGAATSLNNRMKSRPSLMKLFESTFGSKARMDIKHSLKRMNIERSLSFMDAHRSAQKFFKREFETVEGELGEAARLVITESEEEYRKAEDALQSYKEEEVESVVSHKFCSILLNYGVHYITKLSRAGLLKDAEAEHLVEKVEEHLDNISCCHEKVHSGEVDIDFQGVWDETNDEHIGGIKNGEDNHKDF